MSADKHTQLTFWDPLFGRIFLGGLGAVNIKAGSSSSSGLQAGSTEDKRRMKISLKNFVTKLHF